MRNNGKNEPDGLPMRLKRWFGRWTRQGVLNVLLVCLIAGVGLGKQLLIQPRVLQQAGQDVVHVKTVSVLNLRLTDIFLPKTLRIEWQGNAGDRIHIERTGPTGTVVLVQADELPSAGSHFTYDDVFDFTPGATYVYSVTQLDPPIPPDAYHTYIVDWSDPKSITVVPQEVIPTDNQTVDGRWDPRYSTYVYINHKFGTTFYRGGLYAGFNQDNSEVGRSFLRFALPSIASGQYLWPVGSLNAYYTRSYGNGSTTVACQSVSANWDAANLTWETASALTLAPAAPSVTVTYDSAQPAPAWQHWEMPGDIMNAAAGNAPVAFGLASTHETQGGWPYFAKKEYAGGQFAPAVLYATGATLSVLTLTIQPATVPGGSGATGTVTLNGPAPTGGTQVYLITFASATALHLPASVTVSAGATQATFAITTSTVSAPETDTIKASLDSTGQGDGVEAPLTITP